MFWKKEWKNAVLIEGEKEAMAISRFEKLPSVNHNFNDYPVDLVLEGRRTVWDAIKKAIELSKMNIYNMFYKE